MEISSKYRKIIAWGAGEIFRNANLSTLNIEYVIDNDVNKQGKTINGIKCCEPDILLRESPEETLVLITTNYWLDIEKQIRGLGFWGAVCNCENFWPNPFNVFDPFRRAYALFCEDAIILNMCKRYGVTVESYIDIGGNHPIFGNATYCFYENGSSGIIIEPNSYFENEYKKYRPKDEFLNVALSDAESDNGVRSFYYFPDIDTRSTLVEDMALQVNNLGYRYECRQVKTMSLNKVVDSCGKHVDYISIDIEGNEYSCLKDFDFKKYDVTFFNIEISGDERIKSLLLGNGYVNAATTISNMIFVRDGIIKEE